MTNNQVILAIIIMAAVTAALRFFPFAVFRGNKTPDWLTYLGQRLPCAIMGMLVVYCLRGMSVSSAKSFLPEIFAGAVVAISYLLKRNTLISIISGTVCYMLFVQFLFA